MRVLQVITDTGRRGAQVFATDLGAALGDRGHDVRTLALADGDGDETLAVESIGGARLGGARLGVAAWGALRGALASADVAVAHGSSTLPACAAAGAGVGTPFVYRNIGDPLYWARTAMRRARVRLYLSRAAAVAALWPGSAEVLTGRLGVPTRKVTVIPNGVAAARFPPARPAERRAARERFGLAGDRPVVCYVGALAPEKDVLALLDAVAVMPGVRLLVAGDGSLRGPLEARAERVAAGRVTFAGTLADPRPAFAAADAVALPSRSEGMPAALIEAGLCGVPAVATDVGAVGEVVTPGTGRLVRPGDARALRAALVEVLADADALGRRARAHCLARFEIGVVAAGWEALLAAVAGPGGAPGRLRRTP